MTLESWGQTPAGLLAQQATFPGDDRQERAEAREFERHEARAEFEARLAADPGWQADRQRQLDVAAHIAGRGQVINVRSTIPPELAPLYGARAVAQAGVATWGPSPARPGGMVPTNRLAAEIEEHSRQRLEAARLRQRIENRGLPPGLEGMP